MELPLTKFAASLLFFVAASSSFGFESPSSAPNGTAGPESNRSRWIQKYKRPADIPFPLDNTYSKDREVLGKALFFDPRLSHSQSTSCSSCHNPGFAWGDGLPKGVGSGMKQLGRRSPTIINTAWADLLFWDGRADSLEAQALGPMASPAEMNQPLNQVVQTVNQIPGYKVLFDQAYPGEPINEKTLARAIATYERTVVSAQAPFDKWIAGDESAISDKAKHGFDLFNGKAHCAECHSGWNFTDNGFHDIGLQSEDRGRGAKLRLDTMQFAFKTPTLRNVDHRSPYMHDGSEASLECVIAFYDRGGDMKRPSLSPEIVALHLSGTEVDQLIAFLQTLTSRDQPVEIPELPR